MDKRKATNDKAKSLAYVALFAALTLVLGYLEATIPLPVAIPGVKLGLANVAVLIALYLMGPRWACGICLPEPSPNCASREKWPTRAWTSA